MKFKIQVISNVEFKYGLGQVRKVLMTYEDGTQREVYRTQEWINLQKTLERVEQFLSPTLGDELKKELIVSLWENIEDYGHHCYSYGVDSNEQ
jgi:hypothetical protein